MHVIMTSERIKDSMTMPKTTPLAVLLTKRKHWETNGIVSHSAEKKAPSTHNGDYSH
jgi:hypothetical protein